MKKILMIFIVIFLALPNADVFAGRDNFLMLRYETGETTDTNEEIHGTYNVFENNSLNDWALGFRVITGKNNFQMVSFHSFYKFQNGFQLGAKYDSVSLDHELIGPAFRYVGVIKGKVFTILDVAQYFSTRDNHDKIDVWLHLSLAKKQGWYVGTEIWYYHIRSVIDKCHYRPIKVGYKFKNGLAPFFMPQLRWDDGEYKATSALFGLDIRW